MRVERRKERTARIGIFGVGFHKYWPQFEGLLEELQQKLEVFVKKVQAPGLEVTNFGMVDDAPNRPMRCCPDSRRPTSTWSSATC